MVTWFLGQLEALVIGSLVLILAAVACLKLTPYDMLRIQSNSMQPTFSTGDMVLIDTHRQIQVGDVVAYRSSLTGQIITHRLIRTSADHFTLQTQGDKLSSPDSTISSNQVVGRAVLVIGGLGRVVDEVHHPIGFLIGIVLPATIVLVTEMLQLVKRITMQRYTAVSSH